MANDIVGGPEFVIVNTRLLAFSPLNDFEFAQLKAWVDWRAEKKVEQFSETYFSHLATVAGALQILLVSCRTKPLSVEEAALCVAGINACDQINEFWYNLNFVDVEYPKVPEALASSKPVKQNNSRNDTYLVLAKEYGWTSQQISMLTPYQQIAYAVHTIQMPVFATPPEYYHWLNNK